MTKEGDKKITLEYIENCKIHIKTIKSALDLQTPHEAKNRIEINEALCKIKEYVLKIAPNVPQYEFGLAPLNKILFPLLDVTNNEDKAFFPVYNNISEDQKAMKDNEVLLPTPMIPITVFSKKIYPDNSFKERLSPIWDFKKTEYFSNIPQFVLEPITIINPFCNVISQQDIHNPFDNLFNQITPIIGYESFKNKNSLIDPFNLCNKYKPFLFTSMSDILGNKPLAMGEYSTDIYPRDFMPKPWGDLVKSHNTIDSITPDNMFSRWMDGFSIGLLSTNIGSNFIHIFNGDRSSFDFLTDIGVVGSQTNNRQNITEEDFNNAFVNYLKNKCIVSINHPDYPLLSENLQNIECNIIFHQDKNLMILNVNPSSQSINNYNQTIIRQNYKNKQGLGGKRKSRKHDDVRNKIISEFNKIDESEFKKNKAQVYRNIANILRSIESLTIGLEDSNLEDFVRVTIQNYSKNIILKCLDS